MTPDVTTQVTAGLLMLLVLSVLGMAVVLSLFVVSYVKRARFVASRTLSKRPALESNFSTYRPSAFENPCRWFAVRSSNVKAVQFAVGVHNPIPCSWNEGVTSMAEHNLFISPPIQGWILILGQGLPDPAEDVDECFKLVLKVSRAVGQVQFFSVNRAVNHHAWVKADEGRIQRAYAWAGETLWNQGQPTQAENDLDLKCLAYGERFDPIGLGLSESHCGNADKVPFLAARWSLDPTTIDETMLPFSQGIAGDLNHSRKY